MTADGAEATAAGDYNYLYAINVYCPGAGSFASFSGNAASAPYFGDFNGDGKTDLLYYDNAGYWRYRFSTGLGLTAQQSDPGIASYTSWVVKDWDGDGYDDVVGPHAASGTWHLMRSTGETLGSPVTTGLTFASNPIGATALDLNGDGLDDLAWRDSGNVWRYRPHSLDTALPDLLASAQDGFGTTAGFSYLPITNAAVCTRGTGATYPMVDVQVGRWVVSQMTASDGSGNDTTAALNFSYEAARRDLQGRGFLGFAKRTVIDTTLGYNLKSIETYRQDFPYVGALASRELQQSGGTRLAYTANTWAAMSYGTGYAVRSFPYITSSSSDEHEAGGTQNGVHWRSVVTAVAAIDTSSGLVTDATTTTGPGGTLTVAYDAIGNITSRSDVGSYTYHASKKHAVITAGANSYGYDNNGNLTTRNGAAIIWTSANLPATLNSAGYSATFSYAPDRARWRQVSTYAGGNETTIYVGGMLEKLTTPVRTHWKHLIPTPSGQVQVIRRSDGTSETLYLTTDHLGSTDAVLNAAGTVLARTSFAAWGGRRASNWQGAPTSPEWQAIADTTRRGYTGREHVDNLMLVHINGRVYDPAIGRFQSADPFVDGVEGSQGWNRYGYVKNCSLAFTDPSGFSAEPPSTPIRPIDPVKILEEVLVTASRLLDDAWNNHLAPACCKERAAADLATQATLHFPWQPALCWQG